MSLLQSVEREGAGSSVYSCHSDSLILQLRDINVTYFKFISRQWVNFGISRDSSGFTVPSLQMYINSILTEFMNLHTDPKLEDSTGSIGTKTIKKILLLETTKQF